jgi:uncharacterized membrane protein
MRLVVWAVCAVMIPAAASAQIYGPPAPTNRLPGISMSASQSTVGRDTRKIRHDVREAREDGTLTKREARSLRREANQIDTLAERYGADGLSDSEARELDTRARVLRDVTNTQRITASGKRR